MKKKHLALSLATMFSLNATADDITLESLLDMDLATLQNIQIYTPSKNETTMAKSPGVISVITQDDIKTRGYKTLYEILDEIPGFYNTGVAAWGLTTNRGVAGDNNAGYLFLVDGHSLSNPLRLGVNEEYRFPLLANVDRIEIIRGAGSTLWGSYATKGIIHIFTKNGDKISNEVDDANTIVSYDYESAHKRHSTDVIFAQNFGDEHNLMISYNYSDSDAPWTDGHIAGANGLYQPSWMWFRQNMWDYEPSHDLYVKYKNNDLSINTRINQHEYMYPVVSSFDGKTIGTSDNKHIYTDIKYSPELNKNTDLELRLFTDYRYNLIDQVAQNTSGINLQEKGNDYKIGAESIIKYSGFKDHYMLFGLYTDASQFEYTSAVTIKDIEKNAALFIEENYSGIENFILGLRFDKNFGVVKDDYILPRLAIIYNVDEWSIKYDYSTGVSRMGYTFAGADNPRLSGDAGSYVYTIYTKKPLESKINNLQFAYTNDTFFSALTFYYQKIENLNAYIGGESTGTTFNGLPVNYGVWDIGHITSKGLEFEFTKQFNSDIKIYGNAAYQKSNWEDTGFLSNSYLVDNDNGTTAVPEYTWNLGANYKIDKNFRFNTKYRGWHNMKYITHELASGQKVIDMRGPEHYVDMNLLYSGPYDMQYSLYVKNLFNNNAELAHINSGTLDQPLLRQVGFNIKATF